MCKNTYFIEMIRAVFHENSNNDTTILNYSEISSKCITCLSSLVTLRLSNHTPKHTDTRTHETSKYV